MPDEQTTPDENPPSAGKPFASELVMQPIGDAEHDEDGEAKRYFLWTAITRLGGRIVITRDELFAFVGGPYNATLHWDVNPITGDMTMIANRGEQVLMDDHHA
jgi:hypothetical protein